jgi:hypothetical protein
METGGKIIAQTLAMLGTLASRGLEGLPGRRRCRGSFGHRYSGNTCIA